MRARWKLGKQGDYISRTTEQRGCVSGQQGREVAGNNMMKARQVRL